MDENDEQQVDHAILRLARFKGRQLAGKYGFGRHDAEDVQQDLLLDYLQRSKSFDSHRCNRRTFARLVVDNRVAALVEAQSAACRDYRLCQTSLDQPVESSSPTHLGEMLRDRRYSESQLDLKLDVERILVRLPTVLANICRLLMVCDSVIDAATGAGISRATLYRRLPEIRRAFMEAGRAGAEI